MANPEHLEILKQGVSAWNQWRADNPALEPDFDRAFLMGLFSQGRLKKGQRTRLSGINLSRARLRDAFLGFVDLNEADLTDADLTGANLRDANLRSAHLDNAILKDANLRRVNLSEAKLPGANLMRACLVEANLEGANLTNCNIYGVSVWAIKTNDKTNQSSLLIANYNEATIRVPSLEIAQFIYLLLNHKKLRDVIKAVGEKGVLILGRFTSERKEILDAVADELLELGYLPMIFDFEKIPGQDYTETIMTLAGTSKFIIADITQPKSLPQEAQAIIPNFKIPFVPIIQQGEAMVDV